MQINIQVEGFDKTESLVLTNEDLDNANFVDLVVGEESYTCPVDELLAALLAFNDIRLDQLERNAND